MTASRDDGETLPSETSLASEDTVQADSAGAVSVPPTVVRGRNTPARLRLGRYTLLHLRGRGGIGEVYEADDPELGRRVAIKVLRSDRGNSTGLLREAQALAKLEHPNVVAVYDVGSEEGTVFLVMPLIDGDAIDKWLRARRAEPRAIVAAFVQAGRGLAAAHAAGLVHRDFKPSNVLVDKQGAVRVGDFGLARDVGEAAEIAGTPAYMAPEQFAGKPTAASDQFAFCVALWEVLAGELPYETPTSIDSGMQRAADRVRKPLPRGARIAARVARALERGLATDPAQRFATMSDLLAALAPPRRFGLAIGAGVTLLAGAGVVALALGRGAPPPAAPPAPPPPAPPRLDLAHARALTSFGATACAYSPTVLADGTVVFDRTQHDSVDLYAVPVAGGAPRQLTNAPEWEWRASRGRKPGEVIYLKQDTRAETGEIDALDLATGRSTELVSMYVEDAAASDNTLYFIPYGTATVVERRAGIESNIASLDAYLLTSSPVGELLAGCEKRDGVSSVFALDVASMHVDHIAARCGSRPAFGGDGRNLYYATGDGIHRRELAAGTDALAAPDLRAPGGISVAPDGSVLVYSACEARSRIVDASDGERELVNDATAADPTIGADGTLVWTRIVRGVHVLVARRRDGAELQLTDVDYGSVSDPEISPDGKTVVFVGSGANAGIHLTSLDGSRIMTRLTDSPNDIKAVWASDVLIVLWRGDSTKANSGVLYTIAPDGSGLVSTGTRAVNLYGAVHGRVLAGTSARLFWLDPVRHSVRAGPVVPDNAVTSHLSPNGTWLEFESGVEAVSLWRMRLDPPGKLELVDKLASDVSSRGQTIDNDGHVLASVASWSGDLYAIPVAAGSKL